MVRRRTSTAPGSSAAVVPCAPPASRPRTEIAGMRSRSPSGGGATSSAICSAVSADWRCGRTTWPMGWMVAARRSTRTVRSLAATGCMVTTAQRAATPAGSVAGSPQKRRRRARSGSAAASARSAGILWILGHEDHLRPGPGADGGTCGAPERRGRLSEDGQHIAGLEWDEPGPLGVVADGKHDGKVREGRVVTLEGSVADVPRGVVLHAHEALGRLFRMHPGETERDAGVRDADGPDLRAGGCTVEGQAQQAIGGLEGMQRRDTTETLQQGRRVLCALRRHRLQGRIAAEPRAQLCAGTGAPGQRGAGQRSRGRGRSTRADGRRAPDATPGGATGVRVSGSCRIAAGRAVGVGGEAEAPALPQPIRIHEPCATTEVAAEVECSQRRPIRPVAQEIVRDPPERVARLHGIGRGRHRDGRRGRARRRPGRPPSARRSRRSARGRPACWPPRRPPARGARRSVVRASTPNAMRAARRSRTDEPWRSPTSPLRTCATTARSSCAQQATQATQAATTRRHSASRGSGRQACPRPPRQRVAHDQDEHGRHGREGEQGGDTRRRRCRGSARATAPGRATHRLGRW